MTAPTRLMPIGEILADGHYQRIPLPIRITKVTGWLRRMGVDLPGAFAPLLARCESGPEARFLWEFCTRPGVRLPCDELVGVPPLAVFPQYRWTRYRLDFYLDDGRRTLGVEIDGLAFHNTTADQVAADYARQRAIVAGLCPVMRFTAREATGDPAGCWSEIDAYLHAPEGPARV